MKKTYIWGVVMLAAMLLSACGPTATPTPIPTVALDPAESATGSQFNNGEVVASGYVTAENKANLGFVVGGRLTVVNVQEGQAVKAGQILAELDTTGLQIELNKAQNNLAELTSPGAIALAEQQLAQANKHKDDAKDDFDGLQYPRATDTRIDNTQAAVDLAQKRLTLARDRWHQVARLEQGDERRAAALLEITNAQIALDDLNAKLTWYTNKPDELDSAIIIADYDAAVAAADEAAWLVAELKGESVPATATGAGLNQLRNARNLVASLKSQIANNQIAAPFDGTVAKADAHIGEITNPGQTLFIVSNEEKLVVETTDLSEKDVSKVFEGQKVSIYIKALQSNVDGTVLSISPVADMLGGDVVYRTRIAFDALPEGVLSGMSVDVTYIIE